MSRSPEGYGSGASGLIHLAAKESKRPPMISLYTTVIDGLSSAGELLPVCDSTSSGYCPVCPQIDIKGLMMSEHMTLRIVGAGKQAVCFQGIHTRFSVRYRLKPLEIDYINPPLIRGLAMMIAVLGDDDDHEDRPPEDYCGKRVDASGSRVRVLITANSLSL